VSQASTTPPRACPVIGVHDTKTKLSRGRPFSNSPPDGAVTLNVQLPHRQIDGRVISTVPHDKDISMISDAIVGMTRHVVHRAARPGTLTSQSRDTMFNQSGRL
jgi:hypothetical protein